MTFLGPLVAAYNNCPAGFITAFTAGLDMRILALSPELFRKLLQLDYLASSFL